MGAIIKKYENGNVVIEDLGGYAARSFSANARVQLKKDGTFEIEEAGRIICSFKTADIRATQVLPDAEALVTTTAALLETLLTDFFFLNQAV